MPTFPMRSVTTGVAVVVALFLLSHLAQRAQRNEDAELLLACKATFENGDAALASWKNGSDPCAWSGIACDMAWPHRKWTGRGRVLGM